ncbi:MAG: hypothetical protein HOP12_02965 [Candidatus Eisenbacteria bacterium]|uniref:Transposase n=1 Tax=Eiseniibacteriota bacterium TaxID=2212470 RepID=A0A849SF53_UNCEI|nr:hypothetical protein [Candidatus Eisenbacteria bacterium]
MVIAIGVTMAGTKVVLGMVQTAGENTQVCRQFLKSLVDRGLKYEQGLLCVLEGGRDSTARRARSSDPPR